MGFEKLLRRRTQSQPSPDFDAVFWERFRRDFEPQTRSSFWRRVWAPAFVVLILILGAPTLKEEFRSSEARVLAEKQELLDHLDLFEEFDELLVEDSEWDYLLGAL